MKACTPSKCLAAVLLAAGLLAHTASAATDKSGIIGGETWTPAMSPIRVVGDITVANLTIQPGVEVIFTGDFEFDCSGVLTAVGNAVNKIWFHGDTGITWKGLNFLNSAPGSVLDYCIVENSNDHGIAITNSGPAISNCEIKNNSASESGGGIYISINVIGAALPSIIDCQITNNSAVSFGGGLYVVLDVPGVLQLARSAISSNSAPAGGAGAWVTTAESATTRFVECEIVGNIAQAENRIVWGGGLVFDGAGGSAQMLRCVLRGNQSIVTDSMSTRSYWSAGGAIGNYSGTLVLRNCDLDGNSALTDGGSRNNSGAYGGGLYVASGNASMCNCLIRNNSASGAAGYGGGIEMENGMLNVENCTIANNTPAGLNVDGGDTTVRNSILFFNNSNGNQIEENPGTTTVCYSNIQSGHAGTGNIAQSPLLNADGTLNAFSPCVDTGSPVSSYNDGCLYDPVNRPYGGQGTVMNDMGAFGGPGNCLWETWSGQLKIYFMRGPGTYCYGDTVTLQAWLNGFPFSYQWFKDGVPVVDDPPRVVGATTDKLTILNAGTADIGNYQLVCDEIDSSGAVALKPLGTRTGAGCSGGPPDCPGGPRQDLPGGMLGQHGSGILVYVVAVRATKLAIHL